MANAAYSKENENFFRLSALVIDVSTDLLRETFKTYYQGKLLHVYLAEHRTSTILKGILGRHILSQEQYDQLYPATGNPDVNDFDITLLASLLRNLNVNKPARNNVWTNPLPTDFSIEADVRRIQMARNDLYGHVKTTKMTNQDFMREKQIFEKILLRLAGNIQSSILTTQMIQDKIDHIMNDCIDVSKMKYLQDELDRWHAMDLPQQLDSMRANKDELEAKIKSMQQAPGRMDADTAIAIDKAKMEKRISQTSVAMNGHYDETHRRYVRTRAYHKAKDILCKQKRVVISGIPGSGKSNMAWTLLHDICAAEGSTVKPLRLYSSDDWSDLVDPRENLCIFVDDFGGKNALDAKDISTWEKLVDTILPSLKSVSLVITLRSNLLSTLKTGFTTNQIDKLLDNQVIVNLSDKDKFTFEEKEEILHKYSNEYKVTLDAKVVHDICVGKEVIGFPQCCTMLNKVITAPDQIRAFKEPKSILMDEIDSIKRKDTGVYASLVLVLIFDGSLSLDELKTESAKVKTDHAMNLFGQKHYSIDGIRVNLDQLCHTFLTTDDGKFCFVHDIIQEITFQSFAKTYLLDCLQLCSLKLVSNLCRDESTVEEDDYFVVQPKHYHPINSRFQEAIDLHQSDDLKNTAGAKMWESDEFRKQFFQLYQKRAEKLKLVLSVDDNNESFLVHAARCNNELIVREIIKAVTVLKLESDDKVSVQLDLALQAASGSQNKQMVRILLQKIASCSTELLVQTAKSGNVYLMDSLREKGGDIRCEMPSKLGKTLLHYACLNCRYDMTRYLLDNCRSLLHVGDDEGRMPVYLATIGGSLEIVQYLISEGGDVNCVGPEGESVLHVASYNGRKDIVEYFIEKYGHMLASLDQANRTVLHYAAWGGDIEIFNYLVGKGLDAEATDLSDQNMLLLACRGGRISMVNYLVDQYPTMLGSKDSGGSNCLLWAANGGSVDVVDFLLNKEVPSTSINDWGNNFLIFASANGKEEVVRYGIDNFPDLLHETNYGETTNLHAAALGGNVSVVQYLIDIDLNPTVLDRGGMNALHYACEGGREEMVQYLISEFPRLIHEVTDEGMTVLHYSVMGGNTKAFELILQEGLDPLQRSNSSMNLLHIATFFGYVVYRAYYFHGSLHMVKNIREQYPDMLNEIDANGFTPLHYAAMGGNIQVLQYLIDHGADPWQKSDTGKTLLHIANERGRLQMVTYLIAKYEEMLHRTDNGRWSTLHSAAWGGNVKVFEMMREEGLDATHTTNDNMNILHIACQNGMISMVKYICEKYPTLIAENEALGIPVTYSAAWGGNIKVFQILLHCGLDPLLKTARGENALHGACQTGKMDMVVYLSNKYPHMLRENDSQGQSCFHFAARGGNVKIIEHIRKRGLDPSKLTDEKKSALNLACENAQLDAVRRLCEEFPYMVQNRTKSNWTLLHSSVWGGNISLFELMLREGMDPLCKTQSKETLLHIACRSGKIALVEHICTRYPQLLEEKDEDEFSPLYKSIQGGNERITKRLLELGASPNCLGSNNKNLLYAACEYGRIDTALYLIEKYPLMLAEKTDLNWTPLHTSAWGGNIEMLELMLLHDFDPFQKTSEEENILDIACRNGKIDMVKYVCRQYPGMLEEMDDEGHSCLHKAARGGNVNVLKYLIGLGKDPSATSSENETLLFIACKSGKFKMTDYLVEKYPYMLQIESHEGLSCLHAASIGGKKDVFELMLSKGLSAESKSRQGVTVFYSACGGGNIDMVDHLASLYPDMAFETTRDGYTALHRAAQSGDIKVLERLIEIGLNDVFVKTRENRSILFAACEYGQSKMVDYLCSRYPEMITLKTKDGWTCLHAAAWGGNIQMFEVFVVHGLDVKLKTDGGENVLHAACRNGRLGMAEYIAQKYPHLAAECDNNGYTMLHSAVHGRNIQVFELLRQKFCLDPMAKTKARRNLLHIACYEGVLPMIEYISKHFPHMTNEKDGNGRLPLLIAAEGGHIPAVEKLSGMGMDLVSNQTSTDGMLYAASEGGKFDMAKYLCDKYPEMVHSVNADGLTCLHTAAWGGDIEVMELLLRKGLNPFCKTHVGATILQLSCKNGKLNAVKYICREFPVLISETTNDGESPLHAAAEGGNVEVFEHLLTKGLDPAATTKENKTSLCFACQSGKFEMASYLVKRFPAMLNVMSDKGWTHLHASAQGGNVDVFELLVQKGLEYACKTHKGENVMHVACLSKQIEMVSYLCAMYPQLGFKTDSNLSTPIHHAVKGGSVEVFHCLESLGVEPKAKNYEGMNVIHLASDNGKLEMTRYLCEHYPELLQEDAANGWTCLHTTAWGGNVEILKLLTQKGLDARKRTSTGQTILHAACMSGRVDMVEYILELYPAMMNETENDGFRPVHFAAWEDQVKVLVYLISKGIDLTVKTDGNETILHVACRNAKPKTVGFICDNFPDMMQEEDNNGYFPTHSAAWGGNVEVLQLLLDRGMDPLLVTPLGQNIYDLALSEDRQEMMLFILEKFPNINNS